MTSTKNEEILPLEVTLRIVDTATIGEEVFGIEGNSPRWVDDIIRYLKAGELPTSWEEARKVRSRATRFTLIDGKLYKWCFSIPLLRCTWKEEAKYGIRDIHEGICGNRLGGRSVVVKVMRACKGVCKKVCPMPTTCANP